MVTPLARRCRRTSTQAETDLPISMSCATTLRISPAVWGTWRVANMGKLMTSPPTLSKKLFRSLGATRSPQSVSV